MYHADSIKRNVMGTGFGAVAKQWDRSLNIVYTPCTTLYCFGMFCTCSKAPRNKEAMDTRCQRLENNTYPTMKIID